MNLPETTDGSALIQCPTFGPGISFTEDGEPAVLLLIGAGEQPTHVVGFTIEQANEFWHGFGNTISQARDIDAELADCGDDITDRLAKIMEIRDRLSNGG